jgi:uncharacterized DUF497 family protein
VWEGFEWHESKARANAAKHGVTFREAATAFDDLFSVSTPDPDHSIREQRFVLIGMTSTARMVVVAHVLRGDNIRIISARPATNAERRKYDEA